MQNRHVNRFSDARASSRTRVRSAVRRLVEQLETRSLLAAVSWDGGGDGSAWADAANWSNNAVPGSQDDVTIDVAANPTIVLNGSQNVRTLLNRETVIIEGGDNTATLQAFGQIRNEGSITLASLGDGSARLNASTPAEGPTGLVNAAGATIDATPGPGAAGARTINASVENAGTISAAENETLEINVGGGGRAFVQTGTLTAAALNSGVTVSSAEYRQTAGTLVGPIAVQSSNISITGGAKAGGTLFARSSNRLLAHSAPTVTLAIEGTPSTSTGSLGVGGAVTASAPITLTSSGETARAAQFFVDAGSTFTLAAGGSITAQEGAGGTRTISGSTNSRLVNLGRIEAGAAVNLSVSSLVVEQRGALVAGADATLGFSSVDFQYLAGSSTAGVGLTGSSTLRTFAGAGAGSTIFVRSTNTLIGHDAAGLTVSVETTSVNSTGTLSVPDDAAINGPVVLTSTSGSGTAQLVVGAGTDLTIGAAGSVTATAGTGGPRSISGTTGARLINAGTIAAIGVPLTVSSLRLDHTGVLSASGTGGAVNIGSVDLRYLAGGTNTADVVLNGSSSVETAVGAGAGSTLVARSNNTLRDHAATGLTLRVETTSATSTGTLTVSEDSTIDGPIVLTATSGAGTAQLNLGAGVDLTISPTGSITATAGTGGPRTINGTTNASLVNRGTITAANVTLNGSSFDLSNEGAMAAAGANGLISFSSMDVEQRGTMSAADGATVTFSSGTFDYVSGSNTAGVGVGGGMRLTTRPDAGEGNTFFVRGSNTLVNHAAAGLTLSVETTTTTSTGTLSVPDDDVAVDGPIVLTAGSGSGTAQLVLGAGATLRIGSTGSVTAAAGTGGPRSISGTTGARIINNGTIAASGVVFTVSSVDVDHFGVLSSGGTNAALNLSSMDLRYLGGSNTAGVVAFGSVFIETFAGAGAGNTLAVRNSNTLVNHRAAGLTLSVEASTETSTGSLSVPDDATVAGPIVLTTVSGSGATQLVLNTGATLNVAPAGSINATAGSGGTRTISGTTNTRIVNEGTVAATAILLSMSSFDLDQRGTLSATGVNGAINLSSIDLRYLAGSNTANVVASGGVTIETFAGAGTASTLSLRNQNTLVNHRAAGLTLNVEATTATGTGTLTADRPTAAVDGPIVLIATSGGGTAQLTQSAGNLLTVGATGSITAAAGTGGPRTLGSASQFASIVNLGTIAVETTSGLTLNSPLDNGGLLRLTSGPGNTATLNSTSGPISNRASGTIRKTGGGTVEVTGTFNNLGLVDVTAGVLRLNGDVNIDDPAAVFLGGGRYVIAAASRLGFGSNATLRPTLNTADVEVTGSGVVEFDRLLVNRGAITLLNGADTTIDPEGAARFTNEGILDLSPGSILTIVGGLDFAGVSQPVIRTELASATSFGRVVITGTADLNSPGSTSRFDPDLVNSYDPAPGTRHDVITASMGITNAFDSFQGGPTPSGNTLLLTRPTANVVAVDVGTGAPPPAPQLLTQAFDFQTREALVFTFNQDVSAFLGRKDYTITNLTTGQVLPQSIGTLSYNQTSNQAVLLLTGQLPDARYRLTVQAGDIANAAGVALTTPLTLDFFVLQGDINRDAAVGFADLVLLAQNYGQSGRTYSQGNIDYSTDGMVGFSDLVLLAQQYNRTLAPAAMGVAGLPSKLRVEGRKGIAGDVLA